jgi:hypothetical protein
MVCGSLAKETAEINVNFALIAIVVVFFIVEVVLYVICGGSGMT